MTLNIVSGGGRHGGVFAGIAAASLAAALLAGCGGGGGGGGGSSSGGGGGNNGGGGGNTGGATLIAQSSSIATSNSAIQVGNVATNGVEVDIPASTGLSSGVTPYTLSIYTVPSPPLNSLGQVGPVGNSLVGQVFDVRTSPQNGQPDGGNLTQQANVRIQYPTTLTPGQVNLAEIYYYDTTLNPPAWQSLQPQVIDTTAHTVTVASGRLTYYALFTPGVPGVPNK